MSNVTIEEVNIYPVKSLAGISMHSAELLSTGLKYDRYWMIVNPKNQFVTQRTMPSLALIKTALSDSHLTLTNANGESVEVPIDYERDKVEKSSVWSNDVEVVDAAPSDVNQWLTKSIDAPFSVRLVKMNPKFSRSNHYKVELPNGNPAVVTHFADAFPFLVANSASLHKLNELTNEQFLMNRFRPNIVISGIEAFSEHECESLAGDNYAFSFNYPCERCVMTTIDQATAEKHPEQLPLKSLVGINPMPNSISAAAFGENALLVSGEGEIISVGDQLTIS
ncbi:MAG: MOSC N-terminal beta barrel domain-containing protein [Kangiellaceae bacterium]|nr:MOSC N-terminal beta barrel domain-containing protein [Kangiellaceae bacterium]